VAINVDATLLALAVTGLKPRIELYDIKATPVLLWQSTFSDVSGGVNDVAFSADGKFVVALLGNGRIHRFDAGSGGRHLAVLSRGTATASVPPGALVAVGGEKGEVVLWRLEDGTIDWKIHPRKSRGDIDKIAVSGDGRIIAALEYAGDKTIVRLWRVHNKWALGQFELDGTLYADIALNKTGDTLFLSHEERGLYTLAVNQKESKPVLFSEDTRMCRGKISWINSQDSLQCSSVNAIARVKMDGGKPSLLETGIVSDRWIISVSLQGTTTAAVGAGHLLIWR
jgi:WD40 repeat protein